MGVLKLCVVLFTLHSAWTQKCFENLGCFPIDGDFTSSIRPFPLDPDNPEDIGTVFSLFTPTTKTEAEVLEAVKIGTPEFQLETFRPDLKTKFIVHGFLDNPELTNLVNASWMHQMKDAFLEKDNFNVIIVDWSNGNRLPYGKATSNTRVVGAQIAYLINTLIIEHEVTTADDFHILGHSLGAHIAGYAGERVENLARITGFDPAGPYFENTPTTVRLDESDAEFVDAIHTDGLSVLGVQGYGLLQPVGHVDFYPNKGHHQTGCALGEGSLGGGIVDGVSDLFACNHLRSYRYYIESINAVECRFEAVPCDSEEDYERHRCHSCPEGGCNMMGYGAFKTEHRKWYLDTAADKPYCRFFLDVTISVNDNPDSTDNRGQVSLKIDGSKGTTDTVLIDPRPTKYEPGMNRTLKVANKQNIGALTEAQLTWEHRPLRFFLSDEDGLLDVSEIKVMRTLGGVREENILVSEETPLASGETALFDLVE